MTTAGMRAVPGDRLVIDGDTARVGVVIGVPNPDGSPPYVIRWQRSGHIALVSPDSYSTIVPADCELRPASGPRTVSSGTVSSGTVLSGTALSGTGR